jgi:outer membrane protein OmpA-like peptidoglycan-associated protein/Tol biopolymer transport system component
MRIFTIIAVVLFITDYSYSQRVNKDACPPSANKKLKGMYEKAIKESLPEKRKLLSQILNEDDSFYEAHFEMAMMLIRDQNIKGAKLAFEKVMELCDEYSPYTWYYLGKIAFEDQNYSKCVSMLKRFVKYTGENAKISDSDFMEAQSMLKQAESMAELTAKPVPFNPRPVVDICTELDEYLANLTPDNEIMFFTRKEKAPGTTLGFKEVFYSSENKDWIFDRGTSMPPPFNMKYNNGASTITADNKSMYFVLCENNQVNYCDIWYTRRNTIGWDEFKKINGPVNAPEHWDSQPTISFDGMDIIFASNRPGGYGGVDLYVTRKKPDGSWGVPENLGPEINTKENELTPFLHSDSKTLYFSSKGHKGLGGYDIFMAKQDELGKWSKPKNLGSPINSINDDVSFFVSLDGKRGFFSSDKYKSVGKGGIDVFMFDLYAEVRPEEIRMVKGDISSDPGMKRSGEIELKNLKTKEVTKVKIDSTDGKFVTVVKAKDDYLLTIKKEGIAFSSTVITKADTGALVKKEMEMKKVEPGKAYRLNDINFPTNSAVLSDEARLIIEEFASYLKTNPSMKVAIHGHTDNVGEDGSNLTLSESRAYSVFSYLKQQGVAESRLTYKGYGETKPLASNDTENGRRINRRTEFVILSR